MRSWELTRESPSRQQGTALTPEAMLHWLNTLQRKQGGPQLAELPCTAEKIANGYEWLFQARRRTLAGE